MPKRRNEPPKELSTSELQDSYGSLIAELTDQGKSTRVIATYMEAEYNLQMTSKDVVRVLKAIEEANRPRQCSIDDMAQYVDEALAICLAGRKMNCSLLFQELQKAYAIDASVQTKRTFHKNVMTAMASMQDHEMAAPAASSAPSAANVMPAATAIKFLIDLYKYR